NLGSWELGVGSFSDRAHIFSSEGSFFMRVGAAAVCLFLLGVAPSYAQGTPRAELSGGYSFMHDTDRGEDFSTGWYASAIGNINNWVGVATEIGGNYRTCSKCDRGPFT